MTRHNEADTRRGGNEIIRGEVISVSGDSFVVRRQNPAEDVPCTAGDGVNIIEADLLNSTVEIDAFVMRTNAGEMLSARARSIRFL